MSTRRARIKAVAALPPRRKNLENAEGKAKQNASKDTAEKILKSPKTPIAKSDEKTSPAVKNTIRTPPTLLPITSASKTVPDKVPSPVTVVPPVNNNVNSPKSEKIPVITSTPGIRNVFASPPPRNSPDRRRIASPGIPRSPKPVISNDSIQKPATSQTSTAQECDNRSTISNSSQNNEKGPLAATTEKNNEIPDDYSVPSVPESITDEGVMDGIVPLQTPRSAPNPIDLLKNEIISECAEVSFDPIVPLPSPSKVRPKLRPVPRLAPHRRNSIQGSTSESEDETRRALLTGGATTPAPPRQRHDSHTSHSTLHSVPNSREMNRNRNDSVCSSVSQIATHPPPATSPVKEKHFSKTRRQDISRRTCWKRKDVKRDALTMYDLIFYNPVTNPIIPDQDEISAKEANAKEEAERTAKTQQTEEDADDPPATGAAPVPQIKLGPNGEIILDENSLVIKQSDANRKVSSVVREGSWAGSGGGRYTRAARTAEWGAAETVRFYRALAAIGTDFSLMAPLFPDRTRRDLYLKFKKEERLNGGQVDKALRSATAWDVSRLQEEFTKERAEAAKRAEAARQRLLESKRAEREERLKAIKEARLRPSKGAKALETSVHRSQRPCIEMTADDIVRRALATRSATREANKKIEVEVEVTREKPSSEPPQKPPHPIPPHYATLTLLDGRTAPQHKPHTPDLATLSKVNPQVTPAQQVCLNEVAGVPTNIENGSLVVLRVNDPASPSKTILQTYIAQGAEKLTPISLPPMFLNSVVGYMKKGTPKSTRSPTSSPQLTSPSSVASRDSRSATPSVIQLNPSPAKRQRHSSYTITPI